MALHSSALSLLFIHIITFSLLSVYWNSECSLLAMHSKGQSAYWEAYFSIFYKKYPVCTHESADSNLNTKQDFNLYFFFSNHLSYTRTIQTAPNAYIAISQIDGSVYKPGKTTKEHPDAHHCLLIQRFIKNVAFQSKKCKINWHKKKHHNINFQEKCTFCKQPLQSKSPQV